MIVEMMIAFVQNLADGIGSAMICRILDLPKLQLGILCAWKAPAVTRPPPCSSPVGYCHHHYTNKFVTS